MTMMRLLTGLFALAMAACGPTSVSRLLEVASSRGEQGVGNPGNPLDILFDEAKDNAAMMLAGLGTLPADVPPRVRDFLKEHRRDMINDINASKHDLSNDEGANCALTNVPPDVDTIHFSRPKCAALVTDLDMATRILIHESTHHFPAEDLHPDGPRIADETFCNDVANEVYRAWRRTQDLGRPHWEGKPSLIGAPAARSQHTAVWTGDKMLVWGGCVASDTSIVDCGVYMKTGAAYDPKAPNNQAWTVLPEPSIPERTLHSAIWTGALTVAGAPAVAGTSGDDRMIVWGGCRGVGDACNVSMNDGAAYSPKTKTWQELEVSADTPTPRVYHATAWTGKEMIIWGGQEGHKSADGHTVAVNTGSAYDIATGHWRKLPPSGLAPRQQHTAVWSGHYVVVWGGCDQEVAYQCQKYFNDGMRYDPANDHWSPMSAVDAPDPRRQHTAVWTGSRMIVWGGQHHQAFLETGGVYDPENDKWTPMTAIAPSGRAQHVAVWTGKKMIVWGGVAGIENYVTSFGEFWPDSLDQGNDRWEVHDLTRHPTPARDLTGVWANDHMIVWGGETEKNTFLNRGGAFYSMNL